MTKPKKTPRQVAEEHWEYTEHILVKMVGMMHYFYIEAMIHGYKHGKDSKK